MVERYNRTLENHLALFLNENQNDWDERVPWVLMAYRSAVHESTLIITEQHTMHNSCGTFNINVQ